MDIASADPVEGILIAQLIANEASLRCTRRHGLNHTCLPSLGLLGCCCLGAGRRRRSAGVLSNFTEPTHLQLLATSQPAADSNSGQRLGLRSVQAHGQIERSLWRGKPIGFQLFSRALILGNKDQANHLDRTERHQAADGEAVQHVADLESFLIVKRDRPEGIDRQGCALLKGDRVFVCNSVTGVAGVPVGPYVSITVVRVAERGRGGSQRPTPRNSRRCTPQLQPMGAK
jgi:hypothetical protein